LLHFKDVKIQTLACEKRERCDLIRRPLWENTRSTAADVAGTHMMFFASLLRDWYEFTFLKIRSLVKLSSCRKPSISSKTDFGVELSIFVFLNEPNFNVGNKHFLFSLLEDGVFVLLLLASSRIIWTSAPLILSFELSFTDASTINCLIVAIILVFV